MLVNVAAPTKRKLERLAFALVYNALEIFKGHIWMMCFKAILVALDTGLETKAAGSMHTMSHHADINQLRVRCHKRVNAGVLPVFIDHSASGIEPRLRIKHGNKAVFTVYLFEHIN